MNMELHNAVNILIRALRDDPEYYNSWRANISMPFQDACAKRESGGVYNFHELSNEAADAFLQLLIKSI